MGRAAPEVGGGGAGIWGRLIFGSKPRGDGGTLVRDVVVIVVEAVVDVDVVVVGSVGGVGFV